MNNSKTIKIGMIGAGYLGEFHVQQLQTINNVHLVGFSGGVAIAVMLTADREDIRSLRTIAGNLDHVSLNNFKKMSALSGSLDTMDYANRTKNL